MKLRNILAALVAGVSLFASCVEEADHYLDAVKVSSSYVALDMGDASVTIDMTTTDSWTITDVPEWLTVSPLSGSAGSQKVTFSAKKTLDGRNCEIKVNCGGKVQFINVMQGLATISKATCAEVNSGIEGKSYLVTGVVTRIANTSYGNFYINDGTGELYIYGTVDSKGNYNWGAFDDIQVGDEVTVQGPLAIYNGTYELKDALWIKTTKSLLKIDSIDPEDATIPTKGGDLTVTLSNKGNGLSVEVPESAASWLSIKSVDGDVVTFHAAENVAGPRVVTIVFKTADKKYSAETTLTQLGAAGSLELPMTVEQAIAAAPSLGNTPVYVKGIVSKLVSSKDKSNNYVDGFNSDYGNGSFWISADGVYNNDKTLDFEAYQVNWIGGAKWTDDCPQIEVGAEVVIYGPLTTYNGTSETQGKGAAYIYSINGATTTENGVGASNCPFTVPGAIASVKAGFTGQAYVKGIVSDVLYTFSADYGTGTFWISEDGTSSVTENKKSTTDTSHDFEVYSCYYLGNKPWAEGNDQIAVGDEVVIFGNLTLYNGIAETASKKAYVYSHNGKTE